LFLFLFLLSFSLLNFSGFLPLLESLRGRKRKFKDGINCHFSILETGMRKFSEFQRNWRKRSEIRRQQVFGGRQRKHGKNKEKSHPPQLHVWF